MMSFEAKEAYLRSLNDLPHTKEAIEGALNTLALLARQYPNDKAIEDISEMLQMGLTGIEYEERVRRGELV